MNDFTYRPLYVPGEPEYEKLFGKPVSLKPHLIASLYAQLDAVGRGAA